MTSYIIRRLLLIIPTVFFAISFLFFLFFTLPGDPATLIAGGADRNPNPIPIEQINERYGFDDPLLVQFDNYWKSMLQGDLGESFQTGRSVNEILADQAPNSIRLGVLGRSHRDRRRHQRRPVLGDPKIFDHRQDDHDRHRRVGDPRVRARLPPAVHLRGLPEPTQLARVDAAPNVGHRARRQRGPSSSSPPVEQWRYLILPAITLASVSTALAARMTRGSMLEVLGADYMRTAQAKGLSEREIVTAPRAAQRHAPGHHADRHRLRHHHRRRRAHRDGVLLARSRLDDRRLGRRSATSRSRSGSPWWS